MTLECCWLAFLILQTSLMDSSIFFYLIFSICLPRTRAIDEYSVSGFWPIIVTCMRRRVDFRGANGLRRWRSDRGRPHPAIYRMTPPAIYRMAYIDSTPIQSTEKCSAWSNRWQISTRSFARVMAPPSTSCYTSPCSECPMPHWVCSI